jgi:hypothetical protein
MVQHLHPAQKFMYEYGCFAAFWSNFEMLMEVAICDLTGRDAVDNCKLVNTKTAGQKKQILQDLLIAAGRKDAYDSLQAVFDVADRNGWLHGHILNPNGDFSVLTRLRVEKRGEDLVVSNSRVSFDTSPFEAFYEAFRELENQLGLSKERCNDYIRSLQVE